MNRRAWLKRFLEAGALAFVLGVIAVASGGTDTATWVVFGIAALCGLAALMVALVDSLDHEEKPGGRGSRP